MPIKILFLDCDGVLNSRDWADRYGAYAFRRFDPAAIKRLETIVNKTGCYIVVSSSWRIGKTLTQLQLDLCEAGFPAWLADRVADMTPYLRFDTSKDEYCRGKEIGAWLNKDGNPDDKIAIVDDDHDMGDYKDFLVQTDFATGLLDVHVDKLVAMLGLWSDLTETPIVLQSSTVDTQGDGDAA